MGNSMEHNTEAQGAKNEKPEYVGISELKTEIENGNKKRGAKRIHALLLDQTDPSKKTRSEALLSLLDLALSNESETFKSFMAVEDSNDSQMDALFDELEEADDYAKLKAISKKIAQLLG